MDAGSFESVEPTTSLGQHKFEATRFGEADGPDRSTQHGRDSNGHTCVGNTQISLLLNDQGWQVMVFLGITCASITLRIRWLKSVFFCSCLFYKNGAEASATSFCHIRMEFVGCHDSHCIIEQFLWMKFNGIQICRIWSQIIYCKVFVFLEHPRFTPQKLLLPTWQHQTPHCN